jgi:hypothetical protein
MIQKHGIYFWVIPNGLQISQLLELNPPRFKKKKIKIDVFYFIIDLITVRTYKSSNEEFLDFVDIHSDYFNSFHHDYKEYIQYLKDHQIIETDYYIPEEKSYGYSIHLEHIDFECPFIEIPITDNVIKQKIESNQFYKTLFSPAATSYNHLSKWFNPSLVINSKFAIRKIKKMYQEIEDNKHMYSKRQLSKAKNKLLKNLNVIQELKSQNFYCDLDNNIGRFHSNLTNLKKELRSFITYEGRQLVNIDIRNSQPFLSTCLFRPEFWDRNHSGLNIYKIPTALNIIDGYGISKHDVKTYGMNAYEHIDDLMNRVCVYTMSVTFLLKRLNRESNDYISFSFSRFFYKKVFDKIYPGMQFEKAKAKKSFFQFIYSANNENYWEEKRFISEAFPVATELFEFIKEKDYVLLSHIMQRLESILMIEVISRRIAAEKPQLPFFTVHDSIATLPEEVPYVKQVIKEEFKRYLGIVPKLGVERWD